MIGRGKIFDDPKKKLEMLAYRVEGYSYLQLALHYQLHHTTSMYHCREANVLRVDKSEREKMVKFVKAGKTIDEVAKMYKVPRTVVSSYCSRAGLKGHKFVSSGKKLVLQLPLPGERKKRGFYRQPTEEFVSPRPGWIPDSIGGWTCAGKSIEQIREEQKKRKEESGVVKRMDMLLY